MTYVCLSGGRHRLSNGLQVDRPELSSLAGTGMPHAYEVHKCASGRDLNGITAAVEGIAVDDSASGWDFAFRPWPRQRADSVPARQQLTGKSVSDEPTGPGYKYLFWRHVNFTLCGIGPAAPFPRP
jgi:hypothetical protein